RRERLNDLSLAWIGSGYVLSRQLILGAAAGRDDLEVEEDGNTFANPNQITLRQIDANGAHVAGSKRPVTQEAIVDERGGQSLVYDPVNKRLLVVFHEHFFDDSEAVTARLLDARDPSLSFITAKTVFAGNARNMDIVYHPPSLGYVV